MRWLYLPYLQCSVMLSNMPRPPSLLRLLPLMPLYNRYSSLREPLFSVRICNRTHAYVFLSFFFSFLSLSLAVGEFRSFAVWRSRWDSRCKNFYYELVFWFGMRGWLRSVLLLLFVYLNVVVFSFQLSFTQFLLNFFASLITWENKTRGCT